MNNSFNTVTNPILTGFYPDPSICRVGSDFYLANSTFAYFPGIPIHHSTDLVNWKLAGNVIERPEQLSFKNDRISQGIYAPTIRHHKGIFYVLCTNVNNGDNFIATAEKVEGPWSDPIWLPNAPGIDPSIFFDDDESGGKIWYIGTRPAPEGVKWNGNWEVWVQELDAKKLSRHENPLVGEPYGIWRGALKNCIWPEGPHIYKKDGWYYLIAAEGGTAIDHAVMAARSKSVTEGWVGKPSNPVLTHRYLGHAADVINAGHADLFDDCNGNWWMVLLASRQRGGCTLLGRETFLVPVRWENNWPFVATKTGLIEDVCQIPQYPNNTKTNINCMTAINNTTAGCAMSLNKTTASRVQQTETTRFSRGKNSYTLPDGWLTLRMPTSKTFSLDAKSDVLRIFAQGGTLQTTVDASFVCRRVRHYAWSGTAAVYFNPATDKDTAGLAVVQSEDYQYRLELSSKLIRLIKVEGGKSSVHAESPLDKVVPTNTDGSPKPLLLSVTQNDLSFSFAFGYSESSMTTLAENADGSILDTAKNGSFTGTVAGIFASSNGTQSDGYIDLEWFRYDPE